MAQYRLSRRRRVDEIIWSDVGRDPGVYIFFQTKDGPARYVGRADTDLYRRITGRPYRYYQYKHTLDDIAAYEWECTYYHRFYDTIRTNNVNHPAKPRGLRGLVECPICGE